MSNDRAWIDFIKETVSILDVLKSLGVVDNTVDGSGNRIHVYCPFCSDKNSKNPGAVINIDEKYYHCFVCGYSGDVFSIVQEYLSMSFPEAVKYIVDTFHLNINLDELFNNNSIVLSDAEREIQRLSSILQGAQKYFEKFLVSAPGDVLSDLHDRLPESDWAYARVGWFPGDKEEWLLKQLQVEGASFEDIIASGLYSVSVSGNIYSKIAGRITIPVVSVQGNIVSFGSRVTKYSRNQDAKYINLTNSPINHKKERLFLENIGFKEGAKNSRVIITEGFFDGISGHLLGHKETMSVLGAYLSEEQVLRLPVGIKNVYLAFDMDDAGLKARSNAYHKLFLNKKIFQNFYVITWDRSLGKDFDDLRRGGFTKDDIDVLIKNALPIYVWKLKYNIESKYNSDIPGWLELVLSEAKSFAKTRLFTKLEQVEIAKWFERYTGVALDLGIFVTGEQAYQKAIKKRVDNNKHQLMLIAILAIAYDAGVRLNIDHNNRDMLKGRWTKLMTRLYNHSELEPGDRETMIKSTTVTGLDFSSDVDKSVLEMRLQSLLNNWLVSTRKQYLQEQIEILTRDNATFTEIFRLRRELANL